MADDAGVVIVDDETLDDVGRRAVQATRDARKQGGRPPISSATKVAIAEAYRSGGIEAARELSGSGERWTREFIRQGKQLQLEAKGHG